MQLWLYFVALAIAFISFMAYISFVLILSYYIFLVFFLPKTLYYSYESRGSSYVDQTFSVLLLSLSQSLSTIIGIFTEIGQSIFANLQTLFYFLIICLILVVPFLVWLEYHPDILYGVLTVYQCIFLPFISFVNQFVALLALIHNLVWPIWSGFSEIARFYLRELPISILFCSVFSLSEAFILFKDFISALLFDIRDFFMSSTSPFSSGVVNFDRSFTRLGALLYYSLFSSTNCVCSQGSLLWNILFSWIFDDVDIFNPPILKKRGALTAQSVQQSLTNTTSTRFGRTISSILSAVIEAPQLVIRTFSGGNGPIYTSDIPSIYVSFVNYSIVKTDTALHYNYLVVTMGSLSYTNGFNFTQHLPNYTFQQIPRDSPMGYYPNIKPLSEKVKIALFNVGDLLDYEVHVIFIALYYVFDNFQVPSQSVKDRFPPDNGSTKSVARFISLIPDAIEYIWNLLVGLISTKSRSCDKRDLRAIMDPGGASSLFYQLTSILNASKISNNDNVEASKARIFGTLMYFSHDIEKLFGYIHKEIGSFLGGSAKTITLFVSGTYNTVWRTVIHQFVDSEYKMYPLGIPATGYPLSDTFTPSSPVFPQQFIITPSMCNEPLYTNYTQNSLSMNALIFPWLQSTYKEVTSVHGSFLYGMFKIFISIKGAIDLGSTEAGITIFTTLNIVPNFWDSIVQFLSYFNVMVAESQTQKALFIADWKYDEFTKQVDYVGKNVSTFIKQLDDNDCIGTADYNFTNSGFICNFAYTFESFFAILDGINKQLALAFTATLVPPYKTIDFSYSINVTEYTLRNLTGSVVNIIPPIVVNSDGTTLSTILLVPLRSFVSIFFILLMVPNYLLVLISDLVINAPPMITIQTIFALFGTVIGSLFQYTVNQIIDRVGYAFFVDLMSLFDRLFNTQTIFASLAVSIVTLLDVATALLTEFAIRLLTSLLNVIGTFVSVFFDTVTSMATKLVNFFSALGSFLLFIIVQAPLFLFDFVIGILQVILPPQLGFIVIFLRYVAIGICVIIQFFITTVTAVLNFFGASISPVNLCCNGGCPGLKRDGNETQNDTNSTSTAKIVLNAVNEFIINANGMSKNAGSKHGSYDEKNLRVKIKKYSQAIEKLRIRKGYPEKKRKLHIDGESKSSLEKMLGNFVTKNQVPERTNENIFVPHSFQKKGDNDDGDDVYKYEYKYNTLKKNIQQQEEPKNNDYEIDDDDHQFCIIKDDRYVNHGRFYPTNHALCSGDEKKKRNIHQNISSLNETEIENEEIHVTQDEAMELVANMVDWNGTTSCDLFMNDFVEKNRTVSSLSIMEKIELRDCLSKRSVGELLNFFSQFRWVPTNILYDPFAIIKVVIDGIFAYKVYAQYQRDKVVPRSVFLSESYKTIWREYGLNTTYMTESNYEVMLYNYTLGDYFRMNNANPDFIDALTDGVAILTSGADGIWGSILNVSVDYKDSSIKYMDILIEEKIKEIEEADKKNNNTNPSSVDSINRSTQINAMKSWKNMLELISKTNKELKKRSFYNNLNMFGEGISELHKQNTRQKRWISDINIIDLVKEKLSNIPQKYYKSVISDMNYTFEEINSDKMNSLIDICENLYIEQSMNTAVIYGNNYKDKYLNTKNYIDKVFIDTCLRHKKYYKDNRFVFMHNGISYTKNNVAKLLTTQVKLKRSLDTFYDNIVRHVKDYTETNPVFKVSHGIYKVLTNLNNNANKNISIQSMLKRSTQNVSEDYPCVPAILGYCTNCLVLDSSLSMLYGIGTRLMSNYTLSNNSYLSNTLDAWFNRSTCLYYGTGYFDSSCGCLEETSYQFPAQTSPLSFPSGLRLFEGVDEEGTFYGMLKGNALQSLMNYLSGIFSVSAMKQNVMFMINGQFIAKDSSMNGFSYDTQQAYFGITHYPNLYKTISKYGKIPLGIFSKNPLSGCELYILLFGGKNIRFDVSMCELYGWPDFHSDTSILISQNIYMVLKGPYTNNSVINLVDYVSSLYTYSVTDYLTVPNQIHTSSGDITSELGIVYPQSNRIMAYYNSGSIDLTYLIFYIINLNSAMEALDTLAESISSILRDLGQSFGLFSIEQEGSYLNTEQQSVSGPIMTKEFRNRPMFIYHPGIISSNLNTTTLYNNYIDQNNITLSLSSDNNNIILYQALSNSSSLYVNFVEENENFVGITSTFGVIYDTIIMANYKYDCRIYRRTTLIMGAIVVSLIYVFLLIGISIIASYLGLSSVVTTIWMAVVVMTWLPAFFIYTYNYPLLNLFPVMLTPPCFADDLYQAWTCDVFPKCPKIFYPFVKSNNYTLSNCQSCPSGVEFSHCKYDYGFFDGLDSLMFLMKWFLPDYFSFIFSISGNGGSFGIASFLSSFFPFSALFNSQYYSRKIEIFGNIDMNNINTFDSYIGCFTLTLPSILLPVLILGGVIGAVAAPIVINLFGIIPIFLVIFINYLLFLEAIFTHLTYNYVYVVTPYDIGRTNKLLKDSQKSRDDNMTDSERKEANEIEMNKVMESNIGEGNDTSNTNSSGNKRKNNRYRIHRVKPEICYRKGIIGYIYNNVWYYRYRNKDFIVLDTHTKQENNSKKYYPIKYGRGGVVSSISSLLSTFFNNEEYKILSKHRYEGFTNDEKPRNRNKIHRINVQQDTNNNTLYGNNSRSVFDDGNDYNTNIYFGNQTQYQRH